MTTTHPDPTAVPTEEPQGHDHGDHHVRTYMRVFAALAVFTAIEYFYAQIFANAFVVLVLGLMTWATIKAALVGLYFMHLKYEGNWVYGMLVPAGILAVVLVTALIPDVVLKPETEMNEPDDDSAPVHAVPPFAPGTLPAHGGDSH